MAYQFDWAKFGELVVPGIVVGVIMLFAQLGVELYRVKSKLRAEEGWKAKKEAFTAAIKLIDQLMSSSPWSGPDVPTDYKPTGQRPTAADINAVYAQLMLTAENSEIPKRYFSFFMNGASPAYRAEFIILLRKELFSSAAPIRPEDAKWIF